MQTQPTIHNMTEEQREQAAFVTYAKILEVGYSLSLRYEEIGDDFFKTTEFNEEQAWAMIGLHLKFFELKNKYPDLSNTKTLQLMIDGGFFIVDPIITLPMRKLFTGLRIH
jgi:hypothetical protein